MSKRKENLLRTGTLTRAVLFYIFILLFAMIALPTLMYVLVTFFTTFDVQETFAISVDKVVFFLKSNETTGEFMVVSLGLVTLLYWAIYMNALIRSRMLRNKDGNPEAAGNKEYGSSHFLDIDELSERYIENPIEKLSFKKTIVNLFAKKNKEKELI